MGLFGALVILAIGAFIGYAYFRYRQSHADPMTADADYRDCQVMTDGKADGGKSLAVCYVDKKAKKIKQHLDIAD